VQQRNELEEIQGFKELLILDESGKVVYRNTKANHVSQGLLAGYLASAFSIADRTVITFVSEIQELSFDADNGSVLIMKGQGKYFFLLLEGTPSMGVARLKLKSLVEAYE